MSFDFFLLVIGGVFTIFCAYMDYDWFFSFSKSSAIARLIGRKRARILYMVLGFLLIVLYFMVF